MHKKVLLITPPYHCGVLEASGTWLPVYLVYLAGAVRQAGYEVEIYDAMTDNHELLQIKEHIIASDPDVVGVGAFVATSVEARKVLKVAKEVNPEILTVFGGSYPTIDWQNVLKDDYGYIDFLVRGEGEITFPALLDAYFKNRELESVNGIAFWKDNKPFKTEDRPLMESLDNLSAAWDLVDWSKYFFRTKADSVYAVVSSSRGCDQKCNFCSQQQFWRQCWRGRSPEDFVEEIEHLNKTYGVNVVMLADEEPTKDRERWEKLLDLLIEKNLDVELLVETRADDIVRDEDIMPKYKAAKIVHIYIGVESPYQSRLDTFNKQLKVEDSKKAVALVNKYDIISELSFILGMPEDTPETFQEAIKWAKEFNADLTFFLAIAPWPGSDICKELEPFIEVHDLSKYNLVEPVVKPKTMTIDEVRDALFECFRQFYMGKMTQLPKMSPFKRDYMIKVTKLLAENSYLAEQMKKMSGGKRMPAKMHKIIAEMFTEKVKSKP